MAAKKPAVPTTAAPQTSEAETERTAPTGFQRDAAVSDAPWFIFEEENVIHGALIGIYEMQTDPPRTYAQVELWEPCPVRVGRGEDAEEVMAAKGDIVNLGFTYQLAKWNEKIRPELDSGATWAVWVKVGKKLKLQSGKSVWQLDPRSKRLTAPTTPVVQQQPAADAAADAPF